MRYTQKSPDSGVFLFTQAFLQGRGWID